MKNLLHTQFLMVLIIALCAGLIIVATWGIALDGGSMPTVKTTPNETTMDFSGSTHTNDSTASSSTEASSSSQTTDSSTTQTTGNNTDTPLKPTKKIALTFDDGPHNTYTHKILNLLEQYHAKATFFVCGYMISNSSKDEFQRMIALGCEIGNHTENHKDLTKISDADICEQITKTNEKIAKYSGIDYECKLYRPPYGSIDRDVAEALVEQDIYMHAILWSSDSRDWDYQSQYNKGSISRETAITKAFNTVCNETKDGTVILMHDIHEITPDLLALILEKYSAEGYEFVTVSELFGFDEMTDEDSYYYRYRSTNSILKMN